MSNNSNSSQGLEDIENLYKTITTLNGEKLDIAKVDFVGLNISEKNDLPFEFKIYFQPIDAYQKSDNNHPIINSIYDKNMARYECCVQSSSVSRYYITLKNRTLANMICIYEDLQSFSPCLKKHMQQYPLLYSLEESIVNRNIPPLHMIGIKSGLSNSNAVNLEWLLSRTVDNRNNQHIHGYEYYLNNICNNKIPEFIELVDFIREKYLLWLKKSMLQLWIVAVDIFPDGRCKYKIYLKLNKNLNFFNVHTSLMNFCQCGKTRLDVVDTFFRNHDEMKLYGFALCLDTLGEKSINYYFVSTND